MMAQETFNLDDQLLLVQLLLRCGFANVVLGLAFFIVLTPPVEALWQGTSTDWGPLLLVLVSALGLSQIEARIKDKYFPVFRPVSLGSILIQSLPVILLHFALLAESTQSCGFFTAPLLYYSFGLLGCIALTFKTHPLLRGVLSLIFILSLYGVLTASRMHCGEGGITKVKSDMHTLQTLVEAYRADKQGQVPQNLAALKPNQGGKAYLDFDDFVPGKKPAFHPFLGFRLNPNPCCAAFAVYRPLSATTYAIYGSDKKGNLIQHKGQLLSLPAASS